MNGEWVLVPVEPTPAQLVDGAYEVPDPISHRGELTARLVYRAMLDAAPAAPAMTDAQMEAATLSNDVADELAHRAYLRGVDEGKRQCAAPQQAEPDAYIHKVRVLNGEPGETDYALSFAADSFPLGDAGLFESIDHRPLYRRPPAAEVQRLRAAALALLNELDAEALKDDRDSWEQQASDRTDDVLRFVAERDAARAEVEALRADAERLDSGQIMIDTLDEFGKPKQVWHTGMDLRKAIDAARAAQGERG